MLTKTLLQARGLCRFVGRILCIPSSSLRGREAAETFSGRRGQAMVEFLPAVLVFTLIMSAGLAYFRVMRAAAIRQEAARNIAFAKIDNAGTLTTVDSPDEGRSAASVRLNIEGAPIPTLGDTDNPFVTNQTACFTVIPGGEAVQPLEVKYVSGVSGDIPIMLKTYAVVCRR